MINLFRTNSLYNQWSYSKVLCAHQEWRWCVMWARGRSCAVTYQAEGAFWPHLRRHGFGVGLFGWPHPHVHKQAKSWVLSSRAFFFCEEGTPLILKMRAQYIPFLVVIRRLLRDLSVRSSRAFGTKDKPATRILPPGHHTIGTRRDAVFEI